MASDDQDKPLFAERPEWADVVPVPQYETNTPIAPILYSPECALSNALTLISAFRCSTPRLHYGGLITINR